MSELQVPYSVNEDAKQRAEWLDKRIPLASGEKEYVEFQIKEAVTRALREANGATTGEKQCNLPVVSKFNFEAYKNYVDTYDPKRHGLNKPDTTVKDLLYGIGINIDKKFEHFDGFKKFMNWLKANFYCC